MVQSSMVILYLHCNTKVVVRAMIRNMKELNSR